MKGYKGMKSDMTCRGMQYEIGKTYHEDDIALCQRGLHLCKNLQDVFGYYGLGDDNRFFEVEAFGYIELGDDKCCASDLTIVRELTDIEVNRNYYGGGSGDGNGYSYGDGFGYGYSYGDGCSCNHGNGLYYIDDDDDDYGKGYGYNCKGYGYNYGTNIQQLLIFKEV